MNGTSGSPCQIQVKHIESVCHTTDDDFHRDLLLLQEFNQLRFYKKVTDQNRKINFKLNRR